MSRFNFAWDEPLEDAVREAARERDTSMAEVVRECVRDNVLDGELEVPAWLVAKNRRERAKSKNELEWQRIYFEPNVLDRFQTAFEKGALHNGELKRIEAIHLEDAEILFEDDPDRLEDAKAFVRECAEAAQEADDLSDFDPLDPSDIFGTYTGVERGAARSSGDLEAAVEAVEDRLERLGKTPSASPNREAVIEIVASEYGIKPDHIEDELEGGGR